ncbi:MAG TPA: acyltransferase [Armatimonadota bacterium]|nr:acyltransferase [Armatimonadota bacterium]
MPRPTRAASPRLPQLDVLRGLAVLLVLGHHQWTCALWQRVGWVGVDLFFVLSGFLVAGLLFAEQRRHGDLDLKRFFIRRGFKIYPSYYLFLVLAIPLAWAADRPVRWDLWLGEALFVSNYRGYNWSHTWSLCVEEHFYLALGLGLLWLRRRNPGRPDPFRELPSWVAALCALALLLRIERAAYWQWTLRTHYMPTHIRMDSLLFGVLLAYLYHFHEERLAGWVRPRLRLIAYTSLALLLPCAFLDVFEPLMATFGYSGLYLGFGGVLLCALYWREESPPLFSAMLRPAAAVLARIGYHSYSIYLWHLPFMFLTPRLVGHAEPLRDSRELAFYLLASLSVGIFMGTLVETPFLCLRDRLFPSRSRALSVPQGGEAGSLPPGVVPAAPGA